jgi:hypothetical protein
VRHTRPVRHSGRHRRPGSAGPLVPIVAGLVVLPVAVAIVVSGTVRGRAHTRGGGASSAPPSSSMPPAESDAASPSAAPSADPRLIPFAAYRGLQLHLTSAAVRCVCYHEASYDEAMALRPLGRLRRDYNITKFPRDEPTTDGPDYVIMSSRGRGTPATSAADLVMPRGTRVVSPVTGVVSKVKRYLLYGRYVDTEVQLRPEATPDLRVSMIHLDRVRVREGDAVVQGVSVLGVPRVFPFGDQTDLYVPGHNPHVHLEVVDPSRRR